MNELAASSWDAGINWNAPMGWNIDGLSQPKPVGMWLGSYNGVMGVPYLLDGFEAAWADPRDVSYSHVYATTTEP